MHSVTPRDLALLLGCPESAIPAPCLELFALSNWDYDFIGGPGCDCDHINGQDVLLVRAHDLSSLYPA